MSSTISPNMQLIIPTVGQEAGPQYATDVNNSLTIVDQHDHSSGSGVQINPAGLNISSDLSFQGNNAINLKSTRFTTQNSPLSGPSDLGCLYESGVDLYYNDGLGNQVRITQSGAVAGTPGSIANLTSPASATYVSADATFVWQSDANTPANMDAASYIFRNLTANSFGLTLNPPNAMAANYALTLPSLPASKKIMTMSAAGAMAADYDTDNVTIEVSSSNLQVKDLGIGTAKIAAGAVTGAKIASATITGSNIASATIAGSNIAATTVTASNIVDNTITALQQATPAAGSAGTASFTVTATSYQSVGNVSFSVPTTARPILVYLHGGTDSFIYFNSAGSIKIDDGGSTTYEEFTTDKNSKMPPTAFRAIVVPSALTGSFRVSVKAASISDSVITQNVGIRWIQL